MSMFTQRTVKVRRGASHYQQPGYRSGSKKWFIYRTGKDGKTRRLTADEFLAEEKAKGKTAAAMTIRVNRKWND